MWQANFLIIVYATLGSFCLEIVPKANVTFEMSNAARHFGRLVIGSSTKLISNKNKESNSTNQQAVLEDTEGYQSDQPTSTAWHKMVESKLRRLKPTVYCGGDAMTLRVQGSTMPNFMIDGGDGPVPLTQIPANCGLSVTQGPTDAVFNVDYQGCHVTQQADGHVLPLRLWGMPVKISCPLAPYALPTVSCLASGMVTKISCKSADVLKLKVNGKWDPFIPESSTCGITAESETDRVVINAPYQSSCWQIKGGERFLSILCGNEEFIFSCPDFQDPHLYGHVRIISSHNHDPNVTSPTDSIMATNIATTGLASNPEQPMSYPFSHMYYGYDWAIPARTTTAPSVTSSPTKNAPSTISTSKTVDMMYPFPEMYYPFSPMSNGKPMPQGYHWPFPAKAPTIAPTTTVPTTTTATTTTSTTVASNPQQSAYAFNQMHYPFGPMLYHQNPMPHGYNWAFPAKAPTTAPTTTVPTTTTSTTVASNPQQSAYAFNQMHYPFGPMLYHQNPMPHGYNWAFPAKAPTTAPTTTVPTTTTATTTTSTTVASNPQQSAYAFNQMYYPFGPMHYHYKPIPYGYPWAFPAKAPTTSPTTTAPTTKTTTPQSTATTLTTVANDSQQSVYSFNQMYSPFGSMHCHHRPSHHLGYPLIFPAKASTTAPNKPAPTIKTFATTTKAATNSTSTIIASNPQQSAYPLNQMHHTVGSILYPQKPVLHGYPLAFPPKAHTTAPTTKTAITATIPTIVASNLQQSVYPFNQMSSLFSPMHYQYKPTRLGSHFTSDLPAL
ncbi:mucin-5AC isoform X2 [Ictalurus punctatus]|uniref:Mucin-5AC isoform X2 n=1 Tax=Ictalurus punctatus TaxID=7998 RepID=A0A2D0RZ92_ICTPU|nr:mucin-5AC isoform X2 [Ictalurus punctatus]